MLGIVALFFIFASIVSVFCAFAGMVRLPKGFQGIFWLVFPFAITALFCGLPLSIPVAWNTDQLNRFARNLYDYPLPPDTQVLGTHAEVGLMGNSNHCDFVAEQTLVTRLSQQKIETYYANVEFPPVRSNRQHGDDFWATGIHPPVEPLIEFIQVRKDGQLVFKLSLVDYGYPPGLDFRCH